ncbi:hypothetical protein JOE66_002782 [Subtercola frigoramans]|uniref:Uncharacterized protein n=1 Tax=Subtercola frigoramans TaxID=120298 RepID=A0ABS2L7S1_9MICO|nr:hypothetical protein [Subtercola frigoramans]
MAKLKKSISAQRLSDSALKSTMKTMRIEGRMPLVAPQAITSSRHDHSVVDAFKPAARHSVG